MTQSDGNSFCGDVVSDIFYRIYKSKYVCIINMMILILYNITRKCILTLQYSIETKFYEPLVVMWCISLKMHILQALLQFKIFIIKILKDSLFTFLVLNAVFITVYHVKLSKTTSLQKLFPSDCITL